jgi:hypothetical protein
MFRRRGIVQERRSGTLLPSAEDKLSLGYRERVAGVLIHENYADEK